MFDYGRVFWVVVFCFVQPGCHSGCQEDDLWMCKYHHFTVINAPVPHKETCIFMMSHKHCPYVTPEGKCVPNHTRHLSAFRALMHWMKRCRGECQPLLNYKVKSIKKKKPVFNMPKGEFCLKCVMSVWPSHPVLVFRGFDWGTCLGTAAGRFQSSLPVRWGTSITTDD